MRATTTSLALPLLLVVVAASTTSRVASPASTRCGAFAPLRLAPASPRRRRNAARGCGVPARPPPPCPSVPTSSVQASSLQEQIIRGAKAKLRERETVAARTVAPPPAVDVSDVPAQGEALEPCSYYVREGRPTEIPAIVSALMDAFGHDSFNSYIRQYKHRHLQACFADDRDRRGLFVACALPAAAPAQERIVGFCSVDGRPLDPACIASLVPSNQAGEAAPRPYLSDLAVRVAHRRRGVGDLLVRSCEGWTRKQGHATLYLRVDRENAAGLCLYKAAGYAKTRLPLDKAAVGDEGRRDMTVLLEKSLNDARQRKRKKRTWVRNMLWIPIKNSISRRSIKAMESPPL